MRTTKAQDKAIEAIAERLSARSFTKVSRQAAAAVVMGAGLRVLMEALALNLNLFPDLDLPDLSDQDPEKRSLKAPEAPTKTKAGDRKVGWPKGWTFGDAEWEAAKRHGAPSRDSAERVFDNFQAQAQAKDYKYVRWGAAWSNWCIGVRDGKYGQEWPAPLGIRAVAPPETPQERLNRIQTGLRNAVKPHDRDRAQWSAQRFRSGVSFAGLEEAQKDFDEYRAKREKGAS